MGGFKFMLQSIFIQNFKKFNHGQKIELKPLTIICGRNSSGKSTILQSLLLMKQSISARNDDSFALSFSGPFIIRNNIKDFFHIGNSNCEKTTFSFECNNYEIKFTFKVKDNENFTYVDEYSICNNGKKYISLKYDSGNSKYILSKDSIISNISSGKIPKLFNLKSANISFGMAGLTPYCQLDSIKLPFSILAIENKNFESDLNNIASAHNKLIEHLGAIRYLGPVRVAPQSLYVQYSDPKIDLGYNGENTAQLLWKMQSEPVAKGDKTFKDKINYYLELLGISQKISVARRENIVYSIDVSLDGDSNEKVPISDVGFGISQVLPVILNGLLTKPREIAIFEQPEIHLHPDCKSKLADFFIDLVKSERQVIVETHSTELIDKLRLKIIEDPSLRDFVNIIFVEPNKNSSHEAVAYPIELGEQGSLDKWPKGFCDTAAQLAYQIVLAKARKNRDVKNVKC